MHGFRLNSFVYIGFAFCMVLSFFGKAFFKHLTLGYFSSLPFEIVHR
jgi:hypothetical protein